MIRPMKRLPPSLRLAYRALCAVLILAMVAVPVLKQLGELHEASHAIHVDSHVDNYVADADPMGATPPVEHGDDDRWHALAHVSHCCASMVAVLTDTLPLSLALLPALSIAPTPFRGYRRISVLPFRPPIAG